MGKAKYGFVFLTLLMANCSLLISNLHAQDLIAMHPFRGPPETAEMSSLFFQRMQQELQGVSDGNYTPFPIDLSQLPPDVPEGGFPPWICPSPSITGAAGHAITGEAGLDPDSPGSFRMRLYLWRIDGARLLGSDEMNVSGPEDMNGVPLFLEWVLSWIDTDIPMQSAPIVSVVEYISLQAPPYEHNWLYMGLRGGAGYARWTYDFGTYFAAANQSVSSFFSANVSLQAAVSILSFFRLQAEVNLISDFGPVNDLATGNHEGDFFSLALKTPLLLKFVWQGEQLRTGIFAGAYWHLPLMQLGSDTTLEYFDYKADIPGFVGGMNIGWSLGPGTLFLDLRMEYDGRWYHRDLRGEMHYTNTVRFNVGYEMGFFPKR